MKNNCDCCSQKFGMMFIRCIVPVIIDGKVQELHFCRTCFLEADSMSFTEMMEFMAKGGQKE